MIGATVYDAYRAREWILVSAIVDRFKDQRVSYRYKVGGREYTGSRVGTMVLSGGKDSIDGWSDDMEALLTNAVNEKKPVLVHVNPDNPAESMVNTDIRWAPLVFFVPFALGFGGVGLGALVMMFRTFFPARGPSSGLATTWFFAVLWNAIAMPISFLFVPRIIAEGEWLGLFILVFPLIGVLILWGALYATGKAFVGLFKQGAPAGGLDMNKKAKNLSAEEMRQIHELVEKKRPKMVESMPEVLREMEQDNGARPAMVGMVSAALPDGASRRLAQEDAAEAEAARLAAMGIQPAPQKQRLASYSAEQQVALVKKFTRGGNVIFWIVLGVVLYNTGALAELYHFVMGLVQGGPAP